MGVRKVKRLDLLSAIGSLGEFAADEAAAFRDLIEVSGMLAAREALRLKELSDKERVRRLLGAIQLIYCWLGNVIDQMEKDMESDTDLCGILEAGTFEALQMMLEYLMVSVVTYGLEAEEAEELKQELEAEGLKMRYELEKWKRRFGGEGET